MFRKEINYRLDELEKSSVDEIENKFKAMVDQIEEEIKQLQTIKANVSSVKEKLSSAHTNVSEVFVNVKTGENFVNNATYCIEANKMRIQLGDIEFTANSEILPLLQKIVTLGEFTEINAAVEHNPAAKTQQKNPLLQIKNKKTYCLRAQSDRNTCDVVSICALEDGTITLADYNNLKLKRLNSSTFEVINYFNLPGVPWQLCTIDGQNVAVSVPTKQEVFFISVGNYMTTKHKIKTDFDCFGLAYANSNLFITDESSSVYMYNTSGKKLKKVNKEQPGQGLFSDIRSLVVSKDASKIYVADFDKGLVVLSNNGQVVGVYNDQQLQGAFDCYLSETENVLVCGHNSKNILQFGPDGNLIGEVLKFSGEYKGPRSSCCIQQMTKMIIGMLRDSVEVFEIVAE
ncbi:uncharacterized protein LOC123534904 [Mercenaria mercenaria]|uniref:uncharacterized protein LOC123534904 n=1 Tax=Mercenaria mercenaria TaxID=6596 RepID=UPI00234E972F|nr:uncharacterized protein LOC123534904 [Mercenaria mercenaria]